MTGDRGSEAGETAAWTGLAGSGGVAVALGVSLLVAVPASVGLAGAVQAAVPPGPSSDPPSAGPPAVGPWPADSVVASPAAGTADPVARCTVSATTVAPGESVSLDASGSENATLFRYDREGDGTYGDWLDRSMIEVSYDEPGTYEPRVQVQSADDFTDTASCGTVTVESPNDPPSVAVSHTPTEPETGEQVTATADATDPDGEVVGYEWRVDGEPVVSTPDAEFGYVFEEPGEHTITVVAEDDDGATASASTTVTVVETNDPPTARFDYSPAEPAPGETVSFDSRSSDPDGEVVAREWTVDGEVVGDGPVLEYAFPGPGEYTVALTVTDDDGVSSTAERTVTVGAANEPPSLEVTYEPAEPAPDESVGFAADASDPDGEVVAYEWRVDGEVVGEGSTLEYAFPGPGEYTVSVTAIDDDDATTTAEVTVTVVGENDPPSVEATYSPVEPAPDESVEFRADASDPDGEVVAYEWRVDGEVVGEGSTLEYAFPGPGEYTVSVTVTDDDGATATAETTVTVAGENEPPTVGILADTEAPVTGETVGFEADASDPDGEVAGYEWRVDGEVVGDGPVLEYAFPGPGEYTVSVTVTDDDGATATAERTVTVDPRETPTATPTDTPTATPTGEVDVTARWGHTPLSPAPGQRVTLFARGADDPRLRYRWDVGDDGSVDRRGRLVTYTFAAAGSHDVRLTVVGPDGDRATSTGRIAVENGSEGDAGGTGDLSVWMTPLDPRPGQRVTLSVVPGSSGATEFRWDLDGDGQTDREGRSVTFVPDGESRVSVEAVGGDGGVTTRSATVSPAGEPAPPRRGPSLWLTPLDPRPGQRVTLVADPVVPEDEVAAYRWDLDGDGETDREGRSATYAFPENGTVSVRLTVERTNGSTASVGGTVPVGNATVDPPDGTPTDGTPTDETPVNETPTEQTPDDPPEGTATPSSPTTAPTDGSTDGGDGPGLGVSAALAALALSIGAGLLARRADR